jgi:hypothetical protein
MTTWLTVSQYLAAYGLVVTNPGEAGRSQKLALGRQDLTRFILNRYESLEPLLSWFGNQLRPLSKREVKKGMDFAGKFDFANESQVQLALRLGFSWGHPGIRKTISLSDWDYMRGGWLKERLFLAVYQGVPGVRDVKLGLGVEDPQGNRAEFDLVFILANNLYLVECEPLGPTGGSWIRETLTDFLYKVEALRHHVGFAPRAFLATASQKGLESASQGEQHLIERARQFNIEIISFFRDQDVETYLQALLGLSPPV